MDTASITILLVEDNSSDAKLLQQTLWHLGGEKWQVVHFERLSDAVNACSKRSFDVVLLDLSLPDSQGLNTIAQFHAAAPNIPIVVLTEFDDQEIALQAVANRAQDYLVKGQIIPISIPDKDSYSLPAAPRYTRPHSHRPGIFESQPRVQKSREEEPARMTAFPTGELSPEGTLRVSPADRLRQHEMCPEGIREVSDLEEKARCTASANDGFPDLGDWRWGPPECGNSRRIGVSNEYRYNLLRRTIRYAIERGQILKQLRESEHRLRGIFEQTFQSMALLTPKGIILEINQTALHLWGSQQQDCVGKPLWELESWNFSSANQEWLKSVIAKAADGEFVRHELQLRSANDVMVWIDFSLKPLKDETGKVVLLIVEGRDISDRKRAEAEVVNAWTQERELNEMKSNFVSMVSHEFRNPMTVIRTAVELLESYNHQLSDQQKSKYFGKIQTAIRQMLQLLDEILLLGRSDAGKLQYEPTPLNLENFCSELTQTLQLGASSKHQIIFNFQGEDTLVEVDENLLRYILTNLLSNAIKYSPQGGNIAFDVICQDDTATFQIQDSGIGIPLKDQQRLFETFHRATNVGSIPGTGLGLSIVKKCVDLHQGQIYLQSQVGVGTTFTVKLPLNHHQTTAFGTC